MAKIDFSKPLTQWSTLGFLSLIWGSSFILMKRGLETFSAEEVTAFRLFMVFISLAPFGLKNIHKARGKKGLLLLASGIVGSVIPYFLFIKAQTQIASSLTGALNSLTPIATLLFAVVLFKQRFKMKSILGVLLGFVGALGLIYYSSETPSVDQITIYMIMPVIAAACYGLNVNIIKLHLHDLDAIDLTTLSFLIVGPLSGVYLFFGTDFIPHLTESPKGWESLGYISILAILGTALAIWIFNMLIKETTALFASSVTYLIPIVAIAWGVLDGERFTLVQSFFFMMILAAISLINTRRKIQE